MSSLFARKRVTSPEMLTLPAFCVPADETAKLQQKREAQLEWMRAAGVQYILGSPVKRHRPTYWTQGWRPVIAGTPRWP